MTPQEYKKCTLLAFRLMADKHGVICEMPEKATSGAWVSRTMCKHFFEGQKLVDPYADEAFLSELKKYAPYYIGRYLREISLDEFIEAFC